VDGGEEGSDSAPSEDNMEEEDINKIMNKEPELENKDMQTLHDTKTNEPPTDIAYLED